MLSTLMTILTDDKQLESIESGIMLSHDFTLKTLTISWNSGERALYVVMSKDKKLSPDVEYPFEILVDKYYTHFEKKNLKKALSDLREVFKINVQSYSDALVIIRTIIASEKINGRLAW